MHVLFYVVTALLFHAMFYMCIPCFYYVGILWNMLCQKWLATIIDLVHCRKIQFPHVEDWLRVSSSEPMIWRQNIRIPACRNLATNTSVLVQNYLSILKSTWEHWLIFPRWNVGKTYFWNALQGGLIQQYKYNIFYIANYKFRHYLHIVCLHINCFNYLTTMQ